MSLRVCVIGGGPAGLTAALAAAGNGARVSLLEREERPGRKLLLTGNGKCNYTNRSMGASYYHTDDREAVGKALSLFDNDAAVSWFQGLGIVPLEKHGGCLYPRSEQAGSVLNALREAALSAGVRIVTACEALRVLKGRNGSFQVRTEREMVPCDRLILATGSRAGGGKALEETGTSLAASFGHHPLPFLPALCGIACYEKDFFRTVQGVRTLSDIRLLLDGRETDRDTGELQLTNYGISGIPVFRFSGLVSRALSQGRKAEALIDFLPEVPDKEAFLKKRLTLGCFPTLERFGNGLLNKNLWSALLRSANLKPGLSPAASGEDGLKALADAVGRSRFRLIRTSGYEQAQTCTGGILLQEVDPETMESRFTKGLYFAGEILNADGICGGYNLQWCWTTGTIAGRSASSQDAGRKA